MRHILRRREIVTDDWCYAGETAVPDAPLIVPLAELRADAARWRQRPGRLGVLLAPEDPVEELADELPRLALVAVQFPNVGDGRGYSQGRLLRERLGFTGELRAVGAGVRQDRVYLLARCGFDTLELAAGEDPDAALRAWSRYSVGYQPGDPQVPLARQRFLAPPA
jgi:uncharacterized protein (DUF934 family)